MLAISIPNVSVTDTVVIEGGRLCKPWLLVTEDIREADGIKFVEPTSTDRRWAKMSGVDATGRRLLSKDTFLDHLRAARGPEIMRMLRALPE